MKGRFVIPARIRLHRRGSVSRQRGATVIELVLYLAGAVFSLFGSGTLAARTRTEASNVQALIATVQRFYGTNRDFPTGQFTAALVNADAVPAPMRTAGNPNQLRNQFGGTVFVESGDGVSFTITSNNLPKAACIELAQLPVNPVDVTINAAGVAIPVTAGQATNGCNLANNSIEWSFR